MTHGASGSTSGRTRRDTRANLNCEEARGRGSGPGLGTGRGGRYSASAPAMDSMSAGIPSGHVKLSAVGGETEETVIGS
ncbi:hypothetical protein GCM10009761_31570 [Agromyces terreus]